jgi:hypothetical protein
VWQLVGGENVKFAATMWIIGILFLGTAAAGRTIKILGNDLPALKSRFARSALALVGAAALALGAVYLVNSVHESNTALEPGGTITSPLTTAPATSTPVTTTNIPEATNVAPIERPPAAAPAPGRPVTIINAMPGATNASSAANPPPAPTDSSAVKKTPYGTIQNENNGLCMDLASNQEAAQVLMRPCQPEHTPQLWTVYRDYSIQNHNDMCMTGTGPMAMVIVTRCYSEPEYAHQKWNWIGNGDLTIRDANGLCMDLMPNQPDTRVIAVTCQPDRASQKWHWYMLP